MKRNYFIDFLKGIAILCVLWGHIIQVSSLNNYDFYQNNIFKFIYTFHMPLFGMVSGYLFYDSYCRKGFKNTIKSKIICIGVPIIIWNSLNYIILALMDSIINHELLISISGLIRNIDGLWFLWTILTCSIAVVIIIKFSEESNSKAILIFIYLGGCFICVLFPNRGMNIFIYPYFITGYLFNKYKRKFNKDWVSIYKVVSYFTSIFLILNYKRKYYIYVSGIFPTSIQIGVMEQIIIDVYRWITGFIVSIAVIFVVKDIYEKIVKKFPKICNWIIKLGRRTLQIYIIQTLVIEGLFKRIYTIIVQRVGENILLKNIHLFDVFIAPLMLFIFVSIINFIVSIIMKHSRINRLLFRK